MNIIRLLCLLATLVATAAPSASVVAQVSAVDQLRIYDKTTYSGRLTERVSLYDAPNPKTGVYPAPEQYSADVLFERPDRFKLVLGAGSGSEYRAVADAGIVRWKDLASGLSGKDTAEQVVDPLAMALMATAGELSLFAPPKALPTPKGSDVSGAHLVPKTYGSGVESATAWFRGGQPIGFEFRLRDGRRVFVSVLSFAQNVPTKPSDFLL
ncbi:MAG: hypothetical protein E6Q50_03030 [Lysobacter sp.]|nr:MAG: hypothetical protein E6Q50_03030 [Lysobacter sp.]